MEPREVLPESVSWARVHENSRRGRTLVTLEGYCKSVSTDNDVYKMLQMIRFVEASVNVISYGSKMRSSIVNIRG